MCERCGLCCKYVILKTEQLPTETQRWLNSHPHIKADADTVIIKDTCTFLRRVGRRYTCAIYSQRPQECELSPYLRKQPKLIEKLKALYILPKNI